MSAKPRSCDELGVCQGKACGQCGASDVYPLPILHAADEPVIKSYDREIFLGVMLVSLGITLVTVCGTAGYLYVRWLA
jgi:hypothetical protein